MTIDRSAAERISPWRGLGYAFLMIGAFLDRDTVDAGDMDLSPLEDALPDWDYFGHTDAGQVAERIEGVHVVVTNKVVLDADTLADAEDLELVCVAATGTDNVDLEAARALGISVCNVEGYSTPSVVQHVFALILALYRRLPEYRDAVRRGRWSESRHFTMLDWPILELSGRTLGIVGHGAIGGAVADVATAFGMEILVSGRGAGDRRPGRIPLDKLLGSVDVLSLHCPLTPETRGLVGGRELGLMRPDAVLINTARGGIVDEAALAEALRENRLAGAGVDVLTEEPPPPNHPLLDPAIPNLIVTPHVAWTSRESRQRLVNGLAANIAAWRDGEPRNVISP